MALVAAAVSAGGAIYGMTQGAPANNVQMPEMFQMPNMGSAAQNAYSGIANLPGQGIPGQVVPQYQNTGQNLYNNPYAAMFQQGANYAAPMGQSAATGAFNTGQQFQQAGTSQIPYAQDIMQTAFDPQKELYGRTVQTIQDQTRAGQAARGVATTPYGAAQENDNLRKFNIDWQNQQLGRQATGAQAAGGLLTSGLNTAGGGAQLSAGAVPQYVQSSGLPYSTYNTIGQGQFGALNSQVGGASGAQQMALSPVQEYLQYLGLGNQAGGVANQTGLLGLNQANLGFNQMQTLGGQLGAGISGLTKPGNWNWLNSGSGSGGGFGGGGSDFGGFA